MKVEWAQVGSAAGLVAGGIVTAYGALRGYTDGRSFVRDIIESWQDPSGFKVRATINKTVIRNDRTEYIRLRTVRANRRVTSLKIDHLPIVVQQDGSERPAAISNYYAMPGRATVSPDEPIPMFQINLMADEALRAHKDHSVVVGYIMEETRDVLFTPPGVSLVPPVGSDYAVIEVHFPGCRLSLDIKSKPAIRFYSKDPGTKKETDIPWPSKRADVTFPQYDLDWIRAWVKKPPQDSEICLFWQWKCI